MNSVYEAITLLAANSLDRMSLDDLEKLSCATDFAESEALRLSVVCDKLGYLVAHDDEHRGVGNFKSGEEARDLLGSISHNLSTIAGLINLGRAAEFRARLRKAEAMTA